MSNRIKLRGAGRQNRKTAGRSGAAFLESIFQQAMSLHTAGHLLQAEALYRQILSANPDHPEALHFSGMIFHQKNMSEKAIELLNRTLKLKPDYAEAHITLGNIHLALGRFDEAAAGYQRALILKPDNADAHYNLGVALKDQGRLEEAAVCYRQAIACRPDLADAYYNLGNILLTLGKPDEAAASFQQAITCQPDWVDAHYNLGNAYHIQGKPNEAIASFRRTLIIKPDFIEAYNNLGIILEESGKPEEAIGSFRRALTLRPDFAEAHYNLGNAFRRQGKLDAAGSSFRRAISCRPDYADACYNLGIILHDQGKHGEAIDLYHRAITLKPDYSEAYNNLGIALREKVELDEAAASFRRALEINPDFPEAHSNLGNVLVDQGRIDEAIACYRRAVSINPDLLDLHSNLLLNLNFDPNYPISRYLKEACRYGRQARSKAGELLAGSFLPKPKRLRVGLVSGDLRNHSVGFFLESLLAGIDPTRVELVAYPANRKEDDLTARIRPCFSAWKPIAGMSDQAAARLIHADGVHVLIDLSGHTAHNRLPVFAWKPAPVQVSWLGYSASTGLAEIDYLLADPHVVPAGDEAHFTEAIWRLPETYLCFSPPNEKAALGPLPALSAGRVVFGSFNNPKKMNNSVTALWAKVLQAVPGSRLLLKAKQFSDSTFCEAIRRRYAAFGVSPECLYLKGFIPGRKDHLAAYNLVDIALDPFPYNGTTTTIEGLWMGVPFITRRGDRFVSRVGESIAHNAGLTDWIAVDNDDYVAKAVACAADLEELARLRAGLRQQLAASPLLDVNRFSRNFEAAVWEMWERRQEQQQEVKDL